MDTRLIPGESLDGYLGRLARRLAMRKVSLLHEMGIPVPSALLGNWRKMHVEMPSETLAQIARLTRISEERLAGRQLSRFRHTWFGDSRFKLHRRAKWDFKEWIRVDRLPVNFCSDCAESDLTMLYWSVATAFMCERHGMLLESQVRYPVKRRDYLLHNGKRAVQPAGKELLDVQQRLRGWMEPWDPAAPEQLREVRDAVALVLGVAPEWRGPHPEVAAGFERFVRWRELNDLALEPRVKKRRYDRLAWPGSVMVRADSAIVAAAVSMAMRIVAPDDGVDAVGEFVDLVSQGPDPERRWQRLYDIYRIVPPASLADAFDDAIVSSVGKVTRYHRGER